jgi:hypothetical protein
LALRSSELLRELARLEKLCFVGGWHSPLEDEALRILLAQAVRYFLSSKRSPPIRPFSRDQEWNKGGATTSADALQPQSKTDQPGRFSEAESFGCGNEPRTASSIQCMGPRKCWGIKSSGKEWVIGLKPPLL